MIVFVGNIEAFTFFICPRVRLQNCLLMPILHNKDLASNQSPSRTDVDAI